MLEVWTARISTRDPDAFNVTRKSGDPVFAPSWPLLKSALDRRRAGIPSTDETWATYSKSYLQEMTRSYAANRPAWDALLARPRVVLTCYCTNAERCHRTLLAKVLKHLGADFKGELPPPPAKDAVEREVFKLAMDLGNE